MASVLKARLHVIAGRADQPGFSGDGGPATAAQLSGPSAIAFDAAGNLLIAEAGNNRLRRVDAATGVITTIAGCGEKGDAGDGGPATAARLSSPLGVAVAADGAVLIADTGNHRLRRIDPRTGMIATIAGCGRRGYAGDGGPATEARLAMPAGVVAGPDGHIYTNDFLNNRVRALLPASGAAGAAGAPATRATPATVITIVTVVGPEHGLTAPYGLAFGPDGVMYIVDHGTSSIVRWDAARGVLVPVAGSGATGTGADGVKATESALADAHGVALDRRGTMYVADTGSCRLRMVAPDTGIIITLAGTDDGLVFPAGVAVDKAGAVYVPDFNRHCVFHVET